MGNMANLLPKMENPSEQIQDILAACECIMENLEGETAPKSMELLQTIENSLKEGKLNILEHTKKLKSSFDSEIKTKREVLFLPYKASMWDSLESIYLAAKDDPNWDAFVMPIPYYDKKNGEFTDLHWETNYPKNIPLIDFRKYNIEERRPDVIFIHNPYDDRNIVTSVHPDFYSEKLRNFTDNLVYVPYFVGNGLSVAEHFCTVPGCIFAHKVIVQTEEERKIYVREYGKVARDGVTKFLAFGSPKLDKAVTAKKEDYEIPPDWEKLIGSKKVVFYNLSIGTLLKYTIENGRPSGKYFQKVRNVFEFFKKQSDVVLLWRPHPLLESTIKSMRPWLEAEYAEIVREYKSGGYGIYDDTSDLNRSIAISDVYYGDVSSVTKLFEAAGKKVLMQLFELPYIYGIYDDGDAVWFIDYLNNFYKYSKQNHKTEYIETVHAKNYEANLRIAENKKKLYFAPYKNDKISIFDMEKKSFEQISFKDNGKFKLEFIDVVSFKSFIYFIPIKFSAIMRLNVDTNEIIFFSEWINKISNVHRFFNSCIVDTKIAIVMHEVNAIMFFDMETNGYEIKHIGEKFEQYNDICFYGQNCYISSFYEGYIVKLNGQSNKTSKIKLPASFTRKTNKIGNFIMRYSNKYIWLFPYAANNAYKINADTDEITELPELIEFFENKNIDFFYNDAFASGNFMYISTNGKGIVEYNINTRELNFINDFYDEEMVLLMLREIDKTNKTIIETKSAGKTIWGHFK